MRVKGNSLLLKLLVVELQKSGWSLHEFYTFSDLDKGYNCLEIHIRRKKLAFIMLYSEIRTYKLESIEEVGKLTEDMNHRYLAYYKSLDPDDAWSV